MIIIFSLCFVILIYVYFFYPLILHFLTAKSSQHETYHSDAPLSVALVIPVYNESISIRNKIENALSQDYPIELYKIIVTSDGSTDETVKIAESYTNRGVKVIHSDYRRGKNMALNYAVDQIDCDILVFTDANAIFAESAIKNIVQGFSNPSVGMVCGNLIYYKDSIKNVGKGEGLYFRYESMIKALESKHGAVAVVTGAIYAIRRDLFTALRPEVANDFVHPVQVGSKGYSVKFEPNAKAYEKATESVWQEFKRRSRIVTRGLTAFSLYWKQYNILRGFRGFCFVSHKLLRWFSPIFLSLLFISNFFLDSQLMKLFLFFQILFYSLALSGVFLRRKGGKIIVMPFYFCLINIAAFIGIISFFLGKRESIWDVASSTR